jgi:heat shock protein HslJ
MKRTMMNSAVLTRVRMRVRIRTRTRTIAILAVAVGLLLGGCASTPDAIGGPGPAFHQPLTGTWTLTSGTDAQGTMGIQDTVVTLTLDGKKSHGTGPCNGYGVEVVGDTGAVTITEGVHTEMACTQQYRNALETRYFAALAKVDHAAYVGKSLVLSGTGVELDFARAD